MYRISQPWFPVVALAPHRRRKRSRRLTQAGVGRAVRSNQLSGLAAERTRHGR